MQVAGPGGSAGLLMPKSMPPSSGRQYSPACRSNTIGSRDGARSGCGSVTATWCRTPPAGTGTPASLPTSASSGPPVSTTIGAAIGPWLVCTPVTVSPSVARPVNVTRSRTCTPLVASATA